MASSSNSRKAKLLGEPHGTAAARLRKSLLFELARRCSLLSCFRCGLGIDSAKTLSIEHKQAWQSAPDPRAAFFDLGNIAFSHVGCNSGARVILNHPSAAKTHCLRGHEFTPDNIKPKPGGRRNCHQCHVEFMRQKREGNASYGRSKLNRGASV